MKIIAVASGWSSWRSNWYQFLVLRYERTPSWKSIAFLGFVVFLDP